MPCFLGCVLPVCESHLAHLLDPASQCALAVASRGTLRDAVHRWWDQWAGHAAMALGLLAKSRSARGMTTTGKMFHFHFRNPAIEWWRSNRAVALFHWVARHSAARMRGETARRWRPRKNKPCNRVRHQMRAGSIWDVMDARGYWHGAVVLRTCRGARDARDARDARHAPDAPWHVEFRFLGWSQRFNEWRSTRDWGTRIAPFGHRSLRWSLSPRLRPRQYCIVHRHQVLSAMDAGPPLDAPTALHPSVLAPPECSGYSVAEIVRVFRSPGDARCMVHVCTRVSNGTRVPCAQHEPRPPGHPAGSHPECPRHPIGCAPRMLVLYVRDGDVLPLNDVTAMLMLGKHILDEPHFGTEVDAAHRRVLARASDRARRILAQLDGSPAEREPRRVCGDDPCRRQLERMGARGRAWTGAAHEIHL